MKPKKDIKVPQEMNISVMQKIIPKNQDQFYVSDDFCVGHGINFFKDFLCSNKKGPFIVEDYRLGFLEEGEIQARVNLVDYSITPHKAMILPKGCIVQIISVSEDIRVIGFIASSPLMNPVAQVCGPLKFMIKELNSAEADFFTNYANAIWKLVHLKKYPQETLTGFLYSLITFIFNCDKETPTQNTLTRKQEIFNKFISLINDNSIKEHEVSFYSNKLCLSPRYLSTLIFNQSGKHAKYWIDESLITRAKVLLQHSSKSVNQISYELNFPNDSFFCKFFKRLTGVSPSEYRNQQELSKL